MIYTITYSPLALQHLALWGKSGQKSVITKILRLIEELRQHPETGTGHPEPLKGDMAGYWSRQITKKDRMIYSIQQDIVRIEIISLMGHYNDK